ncbi:MAG: hypothetical protein ACFE95_00235 [Candidatus Hodarchaeota archaeon]
MLKWRPNYHEFQEIFSNNYCLKILMIISQQSQKKEFFCASDIAKILDIHISTVTKYLDLLSKNKFLEKEQLLNKAGKPTYYKPITHNISITLDLPFMTQSLQKISKFQAISNPLVREKPNLAPRVIYKFDDEGVITSFIIKKKTKAKRFVKQKIALSTSQSNFMKYLPHPTMQAEPFLEICKKANLHDFFSIKGMHSFLEKLEKYDIIELNNEIAGKKIGEKYE